jgi:hypothetical protein
MDTQVTAVISQLYGIILKIAGPMAFLRLGIAGLKHLGGEPEAIIQALRQVALGLFIIITARAFVAIITSFSNAIAVIQQ